jgi:hypothetical protein
VAAERNGVWGKAIEVPGLTALSTGDAGVSSVSCPSAGGVYQGRRSHNQGFIVSQTG